MKTEQLLAQIDTTPLEDADAWQMIVDQLRLSPTARKQLPRDLRVLLGDKPRKFWTEEELARLKELYPSRPTEEVAKALGCTVLSVYGAVDKLGLKKSREFLAREVWSKFGRSPGFIAAQFPKGNVPGNKGVKRPGWSCGKMRETQFKKGDKSWRTFPVGHISPDTEGFLRIKIREPLYTSEPYTNYRPLLAWRVWEQHHGRPVPAGHIIRYRDGDRANCAIENLVLVSKKENRRLNSLRAMYPPELVEAIMLNGALKRKLRRQDAEEE
jgi:hypothetical protein